MTPARCAASFLALFVLLQSAGAEEWRDRLKKELPLLGHRNWIVVADSAYPAQTAAGIETIHVGGDQLPVVGAVLEMLAQQKHVRPKIVCDKELSAVSEEDAPGIAAYRAGLTKLLAKQPVAYTPHEQVIGKLDAAAKTFRVIILKTDLALPYTSVFIELDCGYWSEAAEKRLRERLGAAGETNR